jgi:hypothetical protein
MSSIHDLMLEEARQSFFQLESTIANLDTKAFGFVAVDGVLFTLIGYILSLNDLPATGNTDYWYAVPLSSFGISLFFMTYCVWPRKWRSQDLYLTIEKYGTLEPEDAATQLAVNYVTWEDQLLKIHGKKVRAIMSGLGFMIAGILSMLILLIRPFLVDLLLHP